MRFAAPLRNWLLGMAAASFLCAGAVWAQSSASAQQDTTQQQSWNMVGATARLQQKLDASTAHSGQEVRAKLNGSVRVSGMHLNRGTELVGKVDQVQASSNGGTSMLSIVFNQAKMKDGRTVPVKVTVLGAYPSDEAQLAINGNQTMPPPPRHVENNERVDQEAGTLHHVSLHSAVQNQDSVTFRDDRGDLKLKAGTFLELGIAPETGE